MTRSNSKILSVASLVVVVLALVILASQRMQESEPVQQIPESLAENLFWDPVQMTSFTLVDFDNQQYGVDQLEDQWTFVFFGYTFCPDICPVTLANLAAMFRKLESASFPMADVRVLFVSVDPERDTQEVLKGYVPYFDPRFLGVSGSKSQLDGFTRQLGALYYVDEDSPEAHYTVSHNSSVFLIDPQARQYARFAAPHDPDQMSDAFIRIVEYYESLQVAKTSWF
ncbi:MAG: SCO family protein [Gammaproteobacteria bacterium]|jgi:protein SCO1|nr:SCO family protein [Gammaproteobacteria bacterium]MBT4493856.1 SCO family protein [Gammaproteobacteria bacterium]